MLARQSINENKGETWWARSQCVRPPRAVRAGRSGVREGCGERAEEKAAGAAAHRHGTAMESTAVEVSTRVSLSMETSLTTVCTTPLNFKIFAL